MAGFRLHPIEDIDIIRDLDRFTNKSNRIKEAYRRAMQLEKGTLENSIHPAPKEPTTWVIPNEPSVKPAQQQESLKARILFKNNF